MQNVIEQEIATKIDKLFETIHEYQPDPDDTWWLLSYPDEDGCNGNVFLQAKGFLEAMTRSIFLGLRPEKAKKDGQVVGINASGPNALGSCRLIDDVPEEFRNRCLSPADCEALQDQFKRKYPDFDLKVRALDTFLSN